MSKSGAQRHVHKYMQLGNGTWGCGSPECSHVLPRNMGKKINFSMTICWHPKCGDAFMMNDRALKMEYPICETCFQKTIGLTEPRKEGIEGYLKLLNKEKLAEVEVTDMDSDDERGDSELW